jgi:polysaccharide chain length determinant protein (PEP-CTERM system associated)
MKSNSNGKGLTPAAIFRLLQRRKWLLIIPVFLLTPAVAYYATKLPQKFRARALVGAQSVLPGQPARPDAGTVSAQEQMRAVREILFSPAVLGALRNEFHFDGTDAELKQRIEVQIDGPDGFYLGFEGADPRQVTMVANRLATLFVERTAALRHKTVEQRDEALDNEVDRLRGQLAAQEYGLEAYKEKASQELPERLATNLREVENLQQQIQSKNDQITEATGRRSSIAEELSALEKQGVLLQEPPAKTASQTEAEQLRLKLADLRTKYTPEHPEIKRVEQELSDLEHNAPPPPPQSHQPSPAQLRYYALQAELKSIEPRLKTYQQDRDALLAQVQQLETRIDATPAYETAVSERTKEAAMLRSRYETLYGKQQEARLIQRADTGNNGPTYRVLEPATVPPTPYSPHSQRIILFGFAAALGMGVLGMFAAEQLDDTFESGEELEQFTSIPLLSTIPGITTKPPRNEVTRPIAWSVYAGKDAPFAPDQRKLFQKHRIAMLGDPHSLAAQQYAILALKVRQKMVKTDSRVLLVTSAAGAEGKSLTSINLSIALAAMSDEKVLLMDGDLRLPQLQTRLGLPMERGFGEFLSGQETEFLPYVSKVGNLNVISGGARIMNPAKALSSPQTRELIAALRKEYQFVILDCPPLVPIPDAQILASVADAVLFVVRARQTKPELLRRAVDCIGDANIIGAVLNDVEFAATPYAHAYDYHQKHYVDGR